MKIVSVLAAGLAAVSGALASAHPKPYSFQPENAENIWNVCLRLGSPAFTYIGHTNSLRKGEYPSTIQLQ